MIKKILLYIWQLPQNIIGLIMLLFLKPYILKEKYKDITYVVSEKMSGGISLGNYVILSKSYKDKNISHKTWDHEWGHTRDSRMFGPLYLIIIGLPSLIWAWLYGSIIKPTYNGYYKFYTERRADRFGGVIRNIKKED
jgi:hypothetical protein